MLKVNLGIVTKYSMKKYKYFFCYKNLEFSLNIVKLI